MQSSHCHAQENRHHLDCKWCVHQLDVRNDENHDPSKYGQLMTTKWNKVELPHDGSVESSSEVVKQLFDTSCKSTLQSFTNSEANSENTLHQWSPTPWQMLFPTTKKRARHCSESPATKIEQNAAQNNNKKHKTIAINQETNSLSTSLILLAKCHHVIKIKHDPSPPLPDGSRSASFAVRDNVETSDLKRGWKHSQPFSCKNT